VIRSTVVFIGWFFMSGLYFTGRTLSAKRAKKTLIFPFASESQRFSVCKQKVSGEAEGSLGCERPSPCPLPQGEGEVDTAKSLPNWGEGKG
jgi:hypothetical protein